MADKKRNMKRLRLKSVLSKFSIAALLIIVVWGCARVPQLTDVEQPSSRLPFVKVLLDNSARKHTISPVGRDEIAIDCYKNGKRFSYYSRRPVIVRSERQKLKLFTHEGNNLDRDIERIVISSRGKKRRLTCGDTQYRGLFELYSSSGQIKLINIVYMEDYLKGVAPLEIGPTPEDEIEAIKAQAVAARTYAMSHLGQYGAEAGYDLKADITDQLYKGMDVEEKLVSRAVDATRGEVAVYKGKMINAYYHSTCGGATDDVEDVWDKEPQPYLVMVEDEGACIESKYFSWQERFTADQVVLRLGQYLSQERGERVKIGKLTDIRITNRTPGGRVASITFETTSGHYVFNKEKVRWVMRRSDNTEAILRSSKFTLDIRRSSKGDITEVIFNGHGYGHGVGMCQMGARGLAAKGVTYDSILSRYYHGTELKKLY